jgi:hypothetical protein
MLRKLRLNPTCDIDIVKRYRFLLAHQKQLNLTAVLDYFSAHQDSHIDLQHLHDVVVKANALLESVRSKINQPPPSSNEIPKIIWMYWDSGLDAAPEVVKLAYRSWREMNPNHEVRLLDENTVKQYIDADLLFKISSLEATVAHKSDFIRTYLLAVDGGVWADSTTFCWVPLDEWLPAETHQSGFFIFRQPESREDRQITNWFIASSRGNIISTSMVEQLCNYLFKRRDVALTMRKPRHYMHLKNISRTGTGFALLDELESSNTFPYFFYHYLFNEVVANKSSCGIWRHVILSTNLHAKNSGDINNAFVSKQTYKGGYMASDTFLERKALLLKRLTLAV